MKKYFNHQIKKAIVVQNLVTIETLDISPAFANPEEMHEFYEFVYVDSGVLNGHFGEKTVELSQGELLLFPPKTKHHYSAAKDNSASIFLVCFRCNAEILSILDKKVMLDKETRILLSDIVKESKSAFKFPFDKKLKPLKRPPFGAQQMVENNIERLLIHLVRNELNENANIKLVMNSVELENNLVGDITALLKSNVYSRITLEEISEQTFYSKTYLNDIFKHSTGHTIMQYYAALKIEEAKKLLRENVLPTVISDKLRFESPTYFTKVFKKHTNMTPTEFKKTIL